MQANTDKSNYRPHYRYKLKSICRNQEALEENGDFSKEQTDTNQQLLDFFVA